MNRVSFEEIKQMVFISPDVNTQMVKVPQFSYPFGPPYFSEE